MCTLPNSNESERRSWKCKITWHTLAHPFISHLTEDDKYLTQHKERTFLYANIKRTQTYYYCMRKYLVQTF